MNKILASIQFFYGDPTVHSLTYPCRLVCTYNIVYFKMRVRSLAPQLFNAQATAAVASAKLTEAGFCGECAACYSYI